MKRALGWVGNIVLVWLLVMVVALFLLPRFTDWRVDAVLTGSMEPALSVGGVVVIKPVEPVGVEVGDIIAYRSGELVITHRVVEVVDSGGGRSFVAKGDANEEADALPVPAADVIGQVVFDMPYMGYLAAFVKTRPGFLLTIFLPGLAIIILELRSMWRVVLGKDKAEVEPELSSVGTEEPAAALKYGTGPALEAESRWADPEAHPRAGGFRHASLANKVAIGVCIAAGVGIIAILASLWLQV